MLQWGQGRRILSGSTFPQRPTALGREHTLNADRDHEDTRSRFAAAAAGVKPGGERLRYHGRAAAHEDTALKKTMGVIDNTDSRFIPDERSSTTRTHRQKQQESSRPVNEMITLEGASHYEPALGEMLYHLRLHNTHRIDYSGVLIVTTTLPHGSKPHHAYWIRNRRRNLGERPEQHDCYIKRLTVTCRVHKLAPGQLATVYLHNKQHESGLGPAHTSVTIDGQVVTTTSL